MPRTTLLVKICKHCGIQFESLDSRKQFCNRACFKIWYKKWSKDNTTGENNPFYGKTHSQEDKDKMSLGWKKAVDNGFKPHNYKDGRGSQRKSKLTSDRTWRKIRKQTLERDSGKCQMPECNKDALEVHHIIPHRDGGESTSTNLISLCRACHYKIYGKELQYRDLFLGIITTKK